MQFQLREEVWRVLNSRRMLHAPVELPESPDRFPVRAAVVSLYAGYAAIAFKLHQQDPATAVPQIC